MKRPPRRKATSRRPQERAQAESPPLTGFATETDLPRRLVEAYRFSGAAAKYQQERAKGRDRASLHEAGFGLAALQRLEREQNDAVADSFAWKLLEPTLYVRPALQVLQPILATLLPGFGMWWLRECAVSPPDPKTPRERGTALRALAEAGVDTPEFLALLVRTAWPIERAWVRWLQDKHGQSRQRSAGKSRGPVARASLNRAHREAIRVCEKVFDSYANPQKNAAVNNAVVALRELLTTRYGLSAARAGRLIAPFLDLTAGGVKQRYERHHRRRK